MSIIDKIDNCNEDKVRKALKNILQIYLNPAFSSIGKREFDIALFDELQTLGLIEKNPSIYEVASKLKVTRTKARNLIYDSNLRKVDIDLDKELKDVLSQGTVMKDSDKILIQIENPYLIDYLKEKLKRLDYITDGSFSQENVKMSVEAYSSLLESLLDKELVKEINKKLIKNGTITDKSIKGLIKGALKTCGKKVADEAGGELIGEVSDKVFDILKPFFDGKIDDIVKLVDFSNKNK